MAQRRPRSEIRSNHALVAGLIAAVLGTAVIAGFRLGRTGPELENLERRTLDLRFRLRGPQKPGNEVVIVALDDKSYVEDQTLFERRTGWMHLIDALVANDVKAIGVDAFYINAEQILAPDLAKDIDAYLAAHATPPMTAADQLLARVHDETTGDAQLVASLTKAANVVLGVHMGIGAGKVPTDGSVSRAKYGQVVPGPWLPRQVTNVIASLPIFNRAARALGMVTVNEDDTETVRILPMVRALGDSVVAPLSVQMVAQWKGVGRGGIAYLGTEHRVQIGDVSVPLSDDDGIWLNFRGPGGMFPTYSAVDITKGRVDKAALAGKLVLVGITRLDADHTRSPFGPGQNGVEIHANAIDNLLRGDWLHRARWHTDVLVSFGIGVLVALLFWGGLRLPAFAQAAGALLIVIAYMVASYWVFVRNGLWLSWLGPAASGIGVSAVCLLVAYAREVLQRRRLRHAFGHYLAEGVIEELLANPNALALGGERRNLSVLFSDIRGFTSFSEKLAPEQLVKVLNTYLTPMTGAVLGSGGFLDKFIGDAVMAVFGAPVPDERHPFQALECALKMHAELARIAPELAELGVEIQIGVGINSGDMAVGNMGSDEHFNYTVMGDAVNLASRLEGLTKTYGAFCLVGEDARRALPESSGFVFRELDSVRVKGKEKPVAIYELIGNRERQVATYVEVTRFAAGLAAYRAGNFAAARTELAAFAVDNPHDRATTLYLERLATLGDEVPAGWDGVTVFHSK